MALGGSSDSGGVPTGRVVSTLTKGSHMIHKTPATQPMPNNLRSLRNFGEGVPKGRHHREENWAEFKEQQGTKVPT